jgi:hypothetical protein
MTDVEKLAILRTMLDDSDTTSDDTANTYLAAAEKAVINLVYPFGDVSEKTMPERYEYEQIEIAAYMLNKRGAEGETAHTEGGTSRTFETGDIPISLRARITAYAGGF